MLMTHRDLPLNDRVEDIHDWAVEAVFERNLRWFGGIMSFRAASLSAIDSSLTARSSSSEEASDSGGVACVSEGSCAPLDAVHGQPESVSQLSSSSGPAWALLNSSSRTSSSLTMMKV